MATPPPSNGQESQPLLSQNQQQSSSLCSESSSETLEEELSSLQKKLSQAMQGTSNLAKHLPTGTVLAFQVLSPVITNVGTCNDLNRILILSFIVLCAISCFILAFSDSFTDPTTGRVRYGFATFNGLLAIDSLPPLPPETARNYRINVMDFVHGIISMLVFDVVALLDNNVMSCLYPVESPNVKQLLGMLPVVVGFFGCYVFITFPNTRNGIGFPVVRS